MKSVAIFRHSPGEGPGYFATFLERHGLSWRLIAIDAGEAVPADAASFSGLAFMGGPMSANDSTPWIAEECALIRQAVLHGVPVIGHCLGGQLMAKAMGGSVRRNPVKEIGWGEVRVARNDLARAWFGGVERFLAFHWHGETFSVPAGAEALLESTYCPQQGFALGPHLALQCHVEMTAAMVRRWCVEGAEEIAASRGPAVQSVAAIEHELDARVAALNAVADHLYGRWLQGLAP